MQKKRGRYNQIITFGYVIGHSLSAVSLGLKISSVFENVSENETNSRVLDVLQLSVLSNP